MDKLDLTAVTGFTDFSDLTVAPGRGRHVVSFADETIVITGIRAELIKADDFALLT